MYLNVGDLPYRRVKHSASVVVSGNPYSDLILHYMSLISFRIFFDIVRLADELYEVVSTSKPC